jgi:hypothetical protein
MTDTRQQRHGFDEMREWLQDIVGVSNPTSSLDRRLQTQREEFIVLKKDQEDIKGQLNDLGAAVQALVVEFKESRKVNYPLLVLLFSLIPFAGGGGLYFVSGQIDKAISPVSSSIIQIQTNQAAHDKVLAELNARNNQQDRQINNSNNQLNTLQVTVKDLVESNVRLTSQAASSSVADSSSATDRQQLNMRLQELERNAAKNAADRSSARAEVSARLVEIEQQFHAISNIMNIQLAFQNRLNAMLWEKTHPGERYPSRDFFPSTIYQNSPQPLGGGSDKHQE